MLSFWVFIVINQLINQSINHHYSSVKQSCSTWWASLVVAGLFMGFRMRRSTSPACTDHREHKYFPSMACLIDFPSILPRPSGTENQVHVTLARLQACDSMFCRFFLWVLSNSYDFDFLSIFSWVLSISYVFLFSSIFLLSFIDFLWFWFFPRFFH